MALHSERPGPIAQSPIWSAQRERERERDSCWFLPQHRIICTIWPGQNNSRDGSVESELIVSSSRH